jgi:hypothetical protein
VRTFDFDAHELFVRARFMVYSFATQKCVFSDWSDAFDVGADLGRDAPKVPDTGEDRPAVTDARIEDGALIYGVSYPESIRSAAYALLCGYGISLNFESQLRADGGEWQYWATDGGDYSYLSGWRSTPIDELADAKTIEYRCRLTGNNPDNGTAIITGWSDYVTVKDGAVEIAENDDPFGTKAEAQRQKDAEKEANKCKLCGFCPFHPFGVCMFLWLAGILLIALVIVYNIYAAKKKKQRAAEYRTLSCPASGPVPARASNSCTMVRISGQYTRQTETRVARYKSASNRACPSERLESLNRLLTMARCPELEIGRISAIPWIRPSSTAFQMVIAETPINIVNLILT